jgi:hypothetical protein
MSHLRRDYRRRKTDMAKSREMAKSRTGLDHRYRDKTGRIEREHGNTKVVALRK